METFNQITEWADKFTIWIALFTLFFTFRNWLNNRKGKADINIELHHNGKPPIHLSQSIKRRHLTRSEVQGVLANAYHHPSKPKARYDIPFLASKDFSQHLESIQDGETDRLVIYIDDETEFLSFHSE